MKALFTASLGSLVIQPVLFLVYLVFASFPNLNFTPWTGVNNDWIAVIFVAIPHLFILGIPTFLFLKKLNKLSYINILLAGLLVGILPILIINASSLMSGGCHETTIQGTSPWFANKIVCNNNFLTLPGWLYVLMRSWVFGLHGVVGAVTFYAIWLKYSLTRHSSGTPNGAP